ncbi:hypothetical protein Y032_0017g3232 [Ancylostoma ceylanicum]|uniref:Uncharacterized protein n=1 Tax=Ancylostoma ceylanicum TaxID=53326 RepID=A0A016V5F3_9BILA|nr:hypothetical protein Y032_0017g3232 [Ancylostoma ceylanicum]
MRVCHLFLTSASVDQYPDAILTAGSECTHPPSVDSCSGAFLTPPSADPYRTFSQLLGQGGPASLGFPHGLVKEDS